MCDFLRPRCGPFSGTIFSLPAPAPLFPAFDLGRIFAVGGETGVLEIELFAQSMPGAGLPRGRVAQINAPAHLVFDLVVARGVQRLAVKDQHVSHLQRHVQWRTVAADFSFGLELAVGRRALGDGAETVWLPGTSRRQPLRSSTSTRGIHTERTCSCGLTWPP